MFEAFYFQYAPTKIITLASSRRRATLDIMLRVLYLCPYNWVHEFGQIYKSTTTLYIYIMCALIYWNNLLQLGLGFIYMIDLSPWSSFLYYLFTNTLGRVYILNLQWKKIDAQTHAPNYLTWENFMKDNTTNTMIVFNCMKTH
jgi:hypothetical protein